MTCKEIRDNFWSYERSELPADLARSITTHLQTCSVCAAEFEQFRHVDSALAGFPAVEPSPYFDQKLNARLNEIERRSSVWDALGIWLRDRYVWTFAALFLVATGLWLGFRLQQSRELDSMEAVLEVQEKYLGPKDSLTTEPKSKVAISKPKAGTTPQEELPEAEEDLIPEEDLAVVENLELLQNYEFIRQFDWVDAANEDSTKTKVR